MLPNDNRDEFNLIFRIYTVFRIGSQVGELGQISIIQSSLNNVHNFIEFMT